MSTTIESRDRLIDILSLSYLGDLLREQLGDDAENYTWPDDFEKAVADIGFSAFVVRGDSEPFDLIVVGDAQSGITFGSTKVFNIKSVRYIGATSIANSALRQCTDLKDVYGEEKILSIRNYAFQQSGVLSAVFPNVTTLGASAFTNCKSLRYAEFPKIAACGDSIFWGCTSLETLIIGSVGYPILTYDYRFTTNCTQTNLTITCFTDAANVNTILTNIRRTATNATIIMKAANDLVYNGTSYAAGDTILTSEVT